MGTIAEQYSHHVFITSDNPRNEKFENIIDDILNGFSYKKFTVIKDRNNAIKEAMAKIDKDSILLLLGKGHDNFQDINGQKYSHNDLEIINEIDSLQ